LVVFNPYSLFGLSKAIAGRVSSNSLWQHHNLRYGRLLDWLRLLNFQPMHSLRGCHQLPVQWQRWLDKTKCLQQLDGKSLKVGGSYYIVVARKQVAPLTPVGRSVWQPLKVPAIPAVKKSGCHSGSHPSYVKHESIEE